MPDNVLGGPTVAAESGCFEECQIDVVEGSVDLKAGGATTNIAAGEGVAVKPKAPKPPAKTKISWDSTFSNEFVKKSADKDAAKIKGAPSAAQIAQKLGPSFASWMGRYEGSRAVAACTGYDCTSLVIGSEEPREYTFAVECHRKYPCTGVGVTQASIDLKIVTYKLPMTNSGKTLSYTLRAATAACLDGSGNVDMVATWTWTATAAGMVNDVDVVTKASGVVPWTNTVTDAGSCARGSGSNKSTIKVTRST